MNKELKTVIFLNYFYIVVSLLSSVLITPVLRYNMGITLFGVYALVVTMGTYLLVNEFGIGNVIISHVSRHRATEDKDGLENFLASALVVYAALSAIALCICIIIGENAQYIFHEIGAEYISRFKSMFSLMAANVFALFFLNYFFSLVTGFEKYIFVRWVLIIKMIVRTVAVVALMVGAADPVWIFASDIILTVVNLIVFAAYGVVKLNVHIRFHRFSIKLINEISGRVIYIYFTMLLDNIYWNISATFLGMAGATEDVGKYLIGITLSLLFIQLSGTIVGYFLPAASKLVAEKAGNDALNNLMISVARGLNVLMCLVLLCFAFLGQQVVQIWVGDGFSQAYTLALIFMCALLYPQIQSVGETILQAQDRYGFRTTVWFISTIFCIGISWFAIFAFGVSMSWLGIVATIIVFRIVVMNIYYHKIGLNMVTFFNKTTPKMLIVIAVSSAFAWLVSLWSSHSVSVLIIKAFAISGAYLTAIWYIYLKQDERAAVSSVLQGMVKRLAKPKP